MSGRILEAGLHLLDRQLIDADGRLAGKVDDLELEFPEGGGPPVVTAILVGPGGSPRRPPAGGVPQPPPRRRRPPPRPRLLRRRQADRERRRPERAQSRPGDQPPRSLDPRPPHRPPPRSRRCARVSCLGPSVTSLEPAMRLR